MSQANGQTEIKCHYIPEKHEMFNLPETSIEPHLRDFKIWGSFFFSLSFIVYCQKTCGEQY